MDKIKVKFWKKPIYFEILSNLENEIAAVEEFRKRTRQTQTSVFRLVISATMICFIIFSIKPEPEPKKQSSLWSFFLQEEKITSEKQEEPPLWFLQLVTIIFGWLASKFVTSYYDEILRENENKLMSLKNNKKGILENLMETETYNVAKDILDRFGKDIGTSKDDSVLRQRNKEVVSESSASFGDATETPEAPPASECQRYLTVTSSTSCNQLISTSYEQKSILSENSDSSSRLVASTNPFDEEFQNPFADDDEELDKIEST